MRTSNETRVKMLPEKRTVVGTEEKSLVCHWSLGLLVCVSVHALPAALWYLPCGS